MALQFFQENFLCKRNGEDLLRGEWRSWSVLFRNKFVCGSKFNLKKKRKRREDHNSEKKYFFFQSCYNGNIFLSPYKPHNFTFGLYPSSVVNIGTVKELAKTYNTSIHLDLDSVYGSIHWSTSQQSWMIAASNANSSTIPMPLQSMFFFLKRFLVLTLNSCIWRN